MPIHAIPSRLSVLPPQVWVCIIKRDEAVRRIVGRDGKSEAEAEARLASQMSNEERVAKAHVVFCTQWEYDYTQQQVEKAWAALQQQAPAAAASPAKANM